MKFLEDKWSRLQHVSDEVLSRSVSGELSPILAFRSRKHLEKCWQCRARREAFEKAAMQLAEFRQRIVARNSVDSNRRVALLFELRRRAERPLEGNIFSQALLHSLPRAGMSMNPAFASAAIVFVAAVLLFWIWHRPPGSISAAQLLDNVVTAEAGLSQGKPGVIYQKVSIATSEMRVEEELYRDAQGVRTRRIVAANEPMHKVLSSVGVDWTAPLSAASYSAWHDRQHLPLDKLVKHGSDRVTLVTRASGSPADSIIEESITMRTSDLHPIARTIQSSAYGTIEIAELNYAVLDWSAVNESLFAPLTAAGPASPVLIQALPSEAELSSSELAVRLELNHLHADEGEQITVRRDERTVEVKGIVDSLDRKQELLRGLRSIGHLKVNLLSISELQAALSDPGTSVSSSVVRAAAVQASPLERYLTKQSNKGLGIPVDDASQRLLDALLQVRQNASDLAALKAGLSQIEESSAKRAALMELSHSYSARMEAGLDAEEKLLQQLGFATPTPSGTEFTPGGLQLEADRNGALCRQLISGSSETTSSAEEIIPEIYKNIALLRAAIASLRFDKL